MNRRNMINLTVAILLGFGFANCKKDKKDNSAMNAFLLNSLSTGISTSYLVTTLSVSGFSKPEAITVDTNGILYIADAGNNAVKKIVSESIVSTITSGSITGTLKSTTLTTPEGISIDTSGNVYVANTKGGDIIKITSESVVSVYSGIYNTKVVLDGDITTSTFNAPEGIFMTSGNELYVIEADSNLVRKISGNTVTTVAGSTAGLSGYLNGTGTTNNLFNAPRGIAVDSKGNIYVSDKGNNAIRKIATSGTTTTFAGSIAGTAGSSDGTGTSASLNAPYSIAIDSNDNLYIADSGNHLIRMITSTGVVTTIAGTSGTGGSTDGLGTKASLNSPKGITYYKTGNSLYVSSTGDNTIRKIALK